MTYNPAREIALDYIGWLATWVSEYGPVEVEIDDVDEDGRAYFKPNALGIVFTAPLSELKGISND